MPRLAVVIVTFNSRSHIDDCLRALDASSVSAERDVVVVDNASSDGTAEHLRTRWPAVRVIEAGRNLGFAAANNVGIRATTSDLILLLNPDTVVASGALEQLIGSLSHRPDVAVIGPRLVDADGRSELSFGSMIGPLAELRQKILVQGHARGLFPIDRYVESLTRRPREVDWVSGACLLVRRADADTAGLMDERFFMYTEDVDFCAAIRRLSRKVLFDPTAVVVHLRGRSVASAARATAIAYRRSQLAFYDKHHPGWAPILRAYLKLRGQKY